MKKITLLITLLISSIGFSQEVIQDFENAGALGEPFGGASASVVADPETGGTRGQVAMLTAAAGGEVFQGVNMAFLKNVELTSSKEMTIDVYSTAGAQFTFAPQILGGLEGAPVSTTSATHGGTGWETLTLTFDKGFDGTTTANGVYTRFVIFLNWDSQTNDFIKPRASQPARTFFVDNISGIAVEPVTDPLPTSASPVPTNYTTHLALINDITDNTAFTNFWEPTYDFGQAPERIDLDASAVTNKVAKINLTIGWGGGINQGGVDVVTDVSTSDTFHFDYYIPSSVNPGSLGHQFYFDLISRNTSNQNTETFYGVGVGNGGAQPFEAIDEQMVFDQWVGVDIPLSTLVARGFDPSRFFQFKIAASSDLRTKLGYFDNFFFYKSDTAGVDQVDGTFFKIYPNPAQSTWNIESLSSPISVVNVYDITGKLIIEQKVDNISTIIDASGFAQGLYIAKISSTDGEVRSIKLTKN